MTTMRVGLTWLSRTSRRGNMPAVPYDPLTSLTPIAHVADLPVLIVCSAKQPYRTLQDVINAGKADPNAITFASAGVGTTLHLSGELLANAVGAKMTHVAYKGSAPALTDVLAGLPREIVERLNADINKVLSMPEVIAFLETQEGASIKRTSPEALAQQLRADIGKWDRGIKQWNITRD